MRSDAKDSFDGLCGPAAPGLHVPCAALATMALPAASPAFRHGSSARAQFCALDSWVRHRSTGHAANSDRSGHLGARSTYRFVALACASCMGCRHSDVFADGLRLLVVALGQPHGAAILAVS